MRGEHAARVEGERNLGSSNIVEIAFLNNCLALTAQNEVKNVVYFPEPLMGFYD